MTRNVDEKDERRGGKRMLSPFKFYFFFALLFPFSFLFGRRKENRYGEGRKEERKGEKQERKGKRNMYIRFLYPSVAIPPKFILFYHLMMFGPIGSRVFLAQLETQTRALWAAWCAFWAAGSARLWLRYN